MSGVTVRRREESGAGAQLAVDRVGGATELVGDLPGDVGLAVQAGVRRGQHRPAGREHRDGGEDGHRADDEGDVQVPVLGELAGGEGCQAAAEEAHEAVGRRRDRPLHGGDEHDGLGGEGVVDADDHPGDDHRGDQHPPRLDEDADHQQVEREQQGDLAGRGIQLGREGGEDRVDQADPMKLTTQANATAYTASGCHGMPARVETLTSPSCDTQQSSGPGRGQNHEGNHIRSSHSACVSGSPVSTGRKKTKVAATTPT